MLVQSDHKTLLRNEPDAAVLEDGFLLEDAKRASKLRSMAQAMNQADGNITRAATFLCMKRPRLSWKAKELNLQ